VDTRVPIHPEVERYARELVGWLAGLLDGNLLAVYLIGSAALGNYVSSHSDVDVTAVCRDPLTLRQKRAVVAAVSRGTSAHPIRGVELVLYSLAAVGGPSRSPAFELNLNTGPAMPLHVGVDPAAEPAHWFVLDLAIARDHGVPLRGPAPAALIAPSPREWLLDAVLESLDWHVEHETLGHYSVLNACRSWRFAEEGVWSSKDTAAAWARGRTGETEVLDAAVATRHGDRSRHLDPTAVKAFVHGVRARVERARR
jgi:hypothetical protein